MTGIWRPVAVGDPQRIRAATWNGLMAIGSAWPIDGAPTSPRPADTHELTSSARTVWCRSVETETVIPMGAGVHLTGSAVDPEEALGSFLGQVIVDGKVAVEPTLGTWTAIAASIIEPGRMGRVVIEGITQARVVVVEPWHQYAALVDTEPYLRTARYGPARILWRESGTGTRWALVSIAPPEPPRSLAYVAVITAVTGTENATYDAVAIDDPSVSVTNAAPRNRPLNATNFDFAPAAEGDRCVIMRRLDTEGMLHHELVVWEVAEDTTCPEAVE